MQYMFDWMTGGREGSNYVKFDPRKRNVGWRLYLEAENEKMAAWSLWKGDWWAKRSNLMATRWRKYQTRLQLRKWTNIIPIIHRDSNPVLEKWSCFEFSAPECKLVICHHSFVQLNLSTEGNHIFWHSSLNNTWFCSRHFNKFLANPGDQPKKWKY